MVATSVGIVLPSSYSQSQVALLWGCFVRFLFVTAELRGPTYLQTRGLGGHSETNMLGLKQQGNSDSRTSFSVSSSSTWQFTSMMSIVWGRMNMTGKAKIILVDGEITERDLMQKEEHQWSDKLQSSHSDHADYCGSETQLLVSFLFVFLCGTGERTQRLHVCPASTLLLSYISSQRLGFLTCRVKRILLISLGWSGSSWGVTCVKFPHVLVEVAVYCILLQDKNKYSSIGNRRQ